MSRRTWLWSLAAALPLVGAAGWLTSHLTAGAPPGSRADCCPPECCPPECCPDCCAAGQVWQEQSKAEPYTCPLTGEELPCPQCCPLGQPAAKAPPNKASCPPCPFCP
jgi:hypothetical protein